MAQVQMKGKCTLPRVASLLFLLRVVFSLFFLCPDSTSVTVHAGAQQVYVSTEGGGDRSAPQSGSTKLANRNNINIVYNAEIKGKVLQFVLLSRLAPIFPAAFFMFIHFFYSLVR
jgi:hypothetical protein